MKIYDIISESIPINENPGSVLSWIAKLSAKAASKRQAIDDLANLWVSQSSTAGVGSGAKVILQGEKAAKAAGIADDVILDAKLLATKLISQSEYALGKAATLKVFGSTWDAINKWTTMLGVGIPISQCAWEIYQAHSKAAQGDPAFQGEKLSIAIQKSFDNCVGKLMALGIGRGIIRAGAAIPRGFFGMFTKETNILEKAVMGLSAGAKTVFTAWLLSPPGQAALAKYVVGNAFGASQFRWVRDTAGGWIMTGYDEILKALGTPLPDYDAVRNNNNSNTDVDSTNTADPGANDVPKSRFDAKTGALLK